MQLFFSQFAPRTALAEGASSLFLKAEHAWDFLRECVFKELPSSLRHLGYRAAFLVNPHPYGLNPVQIKSAKKASQTAQVVLLLHGAGAHPSCFTPLAKRLSEAKIRHVYTASLKQSRDDPVSLEGLSERLDEIAKKYLSKGYRDVEYAFVGHSLGALVGSKWIWRGSRESSDYSTSMMISVSGRLKYLPNRFSWFCEEVKPEIQKTFKKISENPEKALLYTIWGDRDGLVPEKSVHIQGDAERELTVKDWGHGGLIFSREAQEKIVFWLSQKGA